MPAKKRPTSKGRQSASKSSSDPTVDPNALVLQALREAYLENQEDLRTYAEKVREINKKKKALRDYIGQLRGFQARALREACGAGIDLCNMDADAQAALAKLFDKLAVPNDAPDEDTALILYGLCLPDRIPSTGTTTFGQLEAALAELEGQLQTVGDDAQLANVDMQNMLQKQQQTLQQMSNISKSLHDTAMSIIRKIGG